MSNRRKPSTDYCVEPGCTAQATITARGFDNSGLIVETWRLCDTHATEYTRRTGGRIYGDARCNCGRIDHVINRAGRIKTADL